MKWQLNHCARQQAANAAGCSFVQWLAGVGALAAWCLSAPGAELPAATKFRKDIEPILKEYCYDCHGDGAKKGEIAFDELKMDAGQLNQNHELWSKVLRNTRARLMPPEKKPQPSADQREQLARWIKYSAFAIDPKNPDPGRVTVRRLNRVEYRNTIRDLMAIDFNAEAEFPPDDTGFGFDNNGDVLTLSPMLLEKYLDAAKSIVSKAVPMVSSVPAEKIITGRSFRPNDAVPVSGAGRNPQAPSSLSLSYYQPASVTNTVQAPHAGRYQLLVDLTASEKFVDNQFDYNTCRLVFTVDAEEVLQKEFVREGGKTFHYELDRDWKTGEHELAFELQPLAPHTNQIRSLALRIDAVTVRGPWDAKYFVRPKNYERFFSKEAPKTPAERRVYAREVLGSFTRKAYRGPVDAQTVGRLVALAEGVSSQPKQTFEDGIAQAMVAVLGSPRFLFREENTEPNSTRQTYPSVDEYALASRLSYFLWSSMPDEELFRLAAGKKLRQNLAAQVKRMLADARAEALMQNFSGQWLQARDIETVPIESRAVLARDAGAEAGDGGGGRRFGNFGFRPRVQFDADLRKAMRRETELYFGHIVREDRSVTELIESDYTFLNERLANHYGLTNLAVTGTDLRRVTLPADGPRGGVLTHGTVLAVTSNPNRTSPVKRGVFILDNILGTPPPPPPPDIPPLEDAEKEIKGHTPTLRETLALHREKAVCSSCHNRMDPLGLALENFNAMGMWRTQELKQPIDAAGKLITGEMFANIQTLKHILATQHARDFYHTLTEKLLTYALGRGLEYYDVETVARIDQWYVQQFAKFLIKLRRTKNVDGQSLLHNSMIVYGGCNADSNRHTHTNLSLLLAGAGGGSLSPGRYVKHGSKPTTNLFLSLADRMGVRGLDRFGDSTGRLGNV